MNGAHPPAGYDPSAYPPFAVTVDIVVLTIVDRRLHVVLVRRRSDPFAGAWALPGGFVHIDEGLDEAAARELREETGVDAAAFLDQFRAYGDPGRDPRMRVVTIAYLAFLREVPPLVAGSDAADAQLVPVYDVLGAREQLPLAFDHRTILADGVAAARAKLESTSLAAALVGPEFTMSELRGVYEAAWGVSLDPANFRRKVLATEGFVEPTGSRRTPSRSGGKPAEVYRAPTEVVALEHPLRVRSFGPVAPERSAGARESLSSDRFGVGLPAPRSLAARVGAALTRNGVTEATAGSFEGLLGSAEFEHGAVEHLLAALEPTVWRVRVHDDPALQQTMLDAGVVAIGGSEIGDLSARQSDGEIARRLRAAMPGRSERAITTFVRYWRQFLNEMVAGDYVLVPLAGRRVAIGEVVGPYAFRGDAERPELRHTRPVDWLAVLARDRLDPELRARVDAPGTIGRVRVPDAPALVARVLRATTDDHESTPP